MDNTVLLDGAVSVLSEKLQSNPLIAGNCEPLQQQLQEIKQLARGLLDPLDQKALEATEISIIELIIDLEPGLVLLPATGG